MWVQFVFLLVLVVLCISGTYAFCMRMHRVERVCKQYRDEKRMTCAAMNGVNKRAPSSASSASSASPTEEYEPGHRSWSEHAEYNVREA